MAATDLLVEVGDPGSATTLSSPGYTSGSSTSINVASTSNWPSTGKAVIFAIDEAEVVDGEEVQVAGTYNEYEGTVASATSVSNVAWQRGSGDRNYSAGSLTRVYIPVSAERENRLVEWGEHEHDVNGNHDKELITDRTAATPATGDSILLSDANDSDNLKKSTLTNLGANGTWMDTGGLADDAVTDAKRPRLKATFVERAASQSIDSSSDTAISWDTTVYDPEGWDDVGGSNPTRITPTEGGIYYVSLRAEMSSSSVADQIRMTLFQNGSGTYLQERQTWSPDGSYLPVMIASGVITVTANDYLEMKFLHTHGSARNVTGAMRIVKLSD